MAKKVTKNTRKGSSKKKRIGKKKSQSPSFLTSLKHIFIWAFIAAVSFIGLLFLYNYFNPDEVQPESPSVELPTVKPETKPLSKAPSTKDISNKVERSQTGYTVSFPNETELARLRSKQKEQVICHEGYTVSYNSDYKIANWVAWKLTAEEAKSKKVERKNKFAPNPHVKEASAMNEDYTRSGYDRGHLAPAGDMKWSAKAMRESFYLSNICPQNPKLNRGVWKELEELSRLWAIENETLLIVAGPVIEDNMRRMGKNRVGVPPAFYKVICTIKDNQYKGVGFLFENKDCKNIPLQAMAVPIDSVEKVTGVDFFHTLSSDHQQRLKSTIDWAYWSF